MATNQNIASSRRAGKSSPEYLVVQHHQGPLVKGILKVLSQITKDLFKKGILNWEDLNNVRVSTQPESQRASDAVNCILKNIEDDVNCYYKLIPVLKSYSGLTQVAGDMEKALQERGYRSQALASHGDQSELYQDREHTPDYSRQNSGKRRRSLSDSTIKNLKQKQDFTNLERDSAFQDTTTAQDMQNNPEDEYANYDNSAAAQGNMVEHQGFSTPISERKLLGTFQSSHSAADGGSTTDLVDASPQRMSIEEETSKLTLAEKSDFALGKQSVGHSHCLQKVEQLNEEIIDLEKDKQQLTATHQEEIKNLKKKSEQKESELQEHISTKENIIENLKKDQESKNEMIKKLRKEKDDIEGEIEKLKEELRASKETTKELIKKERQEYKDKVASLTEELAKVKKDRENSLTALQETLDEKTEELKRVQESEEKALREVADIKDQLMKVRLAKQEEQHKFELEKQRLEFEKERAQQECERKVFEKDKKLLESKVKLAELKGECALNLKEMAAKNEMEAKEREDAAMKREQDTKKREEAAIIREEAAIIREEEAKEREEAMRKELEAFKKKLN